MHTGDKLIAITIFGFPNNQKAYSGIVQRSFSDYVPRMVNLPSFVEARRRPTKDQTFYLKQKSITSKTTFDKI